MKQMKIINAYKAVEPISKDKDLPSDISYIFYRIRKLLQPQWDFQMEREKALFEKYSPKYENERLVFESPKEAKEFSEEMKKLSDIEVDLGDYKKMDFHPTSSVKLSAEDMEKLEDFLNYV